jgi:hypothetical protein
MAEAGLTRVVLNKYFKQIFTAYILSYAFFFAARPLTDPDFWFHLKTGEYIVTDRVVPRVDLFSFTNPGRAWVAHEWLSETLFYAIYSLLGLNGLIIIFAIIAVVALWIVFRPTNVHPFIGGLAFLLSVWAVVPTIGVRPRVFTLLLAAIYLALLCGYARSGKARTIVWLVPLMIVWVNLHAGFLIGLVLIGLTMIGVFLDAFAAGERLADSYPRIRTLILVFLACLVVVMLNPHGPRVYTFPFEIFSSPVQQELVSDWLSPNFHEAALFPLLLLIILAIAVMVLSPRRPRPSELLFFAATLYATLKSSRHMAIFALIAGPLLAKYLQGWLTSTSFGKAFARAPTIALTGRTIFVALVLVLPLALFVLKLKTTVLAPPQQEVLGIPLHAVEYLRESKVTGNTFTDPNIWGDYLIWATPSNPVYIDGRIDMYGDSFVKEYTDITWGVADWRGPFERYAVRIAIVRAKSPLRRELTSASDWHQVFEDEMAVVFVKK